MQNVCDYLENTKLIGLGEMASTHGMAHLFKVFGVIDTIDVETLTLAEIVEAASVLNAKLFVEILILTSTQLVEDVKVSLLLDLADHA